MLILDKPKIFDGQNLNIPLYHRGHLSLLSGTKVWLCLLPGAKTLTQIPELIVSPINFDAWHDLWRIEVTMYEAVGVVHKLLKVLRNHGLNVLAEESSSIERQRYHTTELIVDASKYSGPTDRDSEQRSQGHIESVPDLERALLAEVIQNITFWPSGKPRIKIRRMKGLHEAAQAYRIAHLAYMKRQGYRPTIEHARAQVEETKGWIRLPSDIESLLGGVLWEETADPRRSNQRKHPSYLLVSDTKERYLRAYFIRSTDAILPVTIEHEERIGALAAITDTIKENGFNILASLSRLYAHGGRAQYELVLQPPEGIAKEGEENIKREFEKVLGTKELSEEYQLAVSYKNSYRSPRDFKAIPRSRSTPKRYLTNDPLIPTEELLERQYSALSVRARSISASDEDVNRLSLVRRLVDDEKRARLTFVPRRILFVSYSFENTSEYTDVLSSEARKWNFEVTFGKKLKEHVHRDGIIRLISESTDFLGIWSEEGAYRVGRKLWPSPWLHWELGVAAAKGLKPRLLISEKIHRDAWKVYPEVPHVIFQPAIFLESLREALGIMASERLYA
jgi:hypothetical protein